MMQEKYQNDAKNGFQDPRMWQVSNKNGGVPFVGIQAKKNHKNNIKQMNKMKSIFAFLGHPAHQSPLYVSEMDAESRDLSENIFFLSKTIRYLYTLYPKYKTKIK